MYRERLVKWCKRIIEILAVIALVILVLSVFCMIHERFFRLDQHATTIFGTTAGVVGSMFGLTAASYAFIWGDLRSDRQSNRHLEKVLGQYREDLWRLFNRALQLTTVVIFSSLTGLAFAQKVTDPSLFKVVQRANIMLSFYYNKKSEYISFIAWFNLAISFAAIYIMFVMNQRIFNRSRQYTVIAEKILDQIDDKYNLELEDRKRQRSLHKLTNKDVNSLEYEKIHNIEILIERILKNHESIGEAFAGGQRREKLLTSVIKSGLEPVCCTTGQQNENESYEIKMEWSYLREDKRKSRLEQCRKRAQLEYDVLFQSSDKDENKSGNRQKPYECGFIAVYDDLLGYRDNSLVYEENCSGKRKEKKIILAERRSLRYTIKRRLLIYYLRGETFSNMDLTGISFSGADLRYTNFSNCNLTGISLMGANCEGADFTGSKMTGMYFDDADRDHVNVTGEIRLACQGDSESTWNPHTGEEPTCLKDAAFKEADVSRAYLKAPDNNVPFSLEGTNFDNAKMFFSYFKNIDFTNSSLEKAQMYNTGLVRTKAKSANFTNATLTNACVAWCDFENADFTDATLTETILTHINFDGTKLINANFSYANITACSFEGASCQNVSFKNMIQNLDFMEKDRPKALGDIASIDFEPIRFCHTILTKTDFSGANLTKISFKNVIGQDCIFTKAEGDNMIFDSSLFASSIFNATHLRNSFFSDTIFRNSVFIGTKFVNGIFDKVDFSNILLNDAEDLCFSGGCMRKVNFSGSEGLSASSFENMILYAVDFSGTGIQECDFSADVRVIGCIWER